MRKHWEGFKNFALSGDIISLAVAFVLAAAFGAVVVAFVEFILMPIVGIIFGEPTFDGLTFEVNDSIIFYGSFLTALVAFVLVAAALYFFVVLPYQKYQDRKAGLAEGEPEADPEDVVLLREIRDALRSSR